MEARIPRILLDEDETSYPIEDYFEELHLEEKTLIGTSVSETIIPLKQIFYRDSEDGRRKKRCILITGDAGYGKSTLTKKLCYDWATLESPSYMSDFEIAVNVPLRETVTRSIEEVVMYKICSNADKRCHDAITSKNLRIVLILDGLDEIKEKGSLISFLKDHNLGRNRFSEHLTVIVTSRPYAVKNLYCLFDRYLSILGFSAETRTKYIQRRMPKSIAAENLIRDIERDPFLGNSSKCPLILFLLYFIYTKDSSFTFTTRTDLYLKIFNVSVKRYQEKYGVSIIALPLTRETVVGNSFFVRLGKVAKDFHFGRLCEDALNIPFSKEEINLLLGSGIVLEVTTFTGSKPVTFYEFSHSVFWHFMVLIYLLDRIKHAPEIDHCLSVPIYILKEMMEPVAGLLGERLLENESAIYFLTSLPLSLTELRKIKHEAGLSGRSWEIFCSRVKRFEYDQKSDDKDLLFSEVDLSNVSEVTIESIEINGKLSRIVKDFVINFPSLCYIIINVSVELFSLPVKQINGGIIFMKMNGTIGDLMIIEKCLSSHRNDIDIIVYLKSDTEEADIQEQKCLLNSILKDKESKPVGILPNVIIYDASDCVVHSEWKIGNSTRMHLGAPGKESEYVKHIPIMVITSEEHSGISHILTETGLKVQGLKNSFGEFVIPQKFGGRNSAEFFEQLNVNWRNPEVDGNYICIANYYGIVCRNFMNSSSHQRMKCIVL